MNEVDEETQGVDFGDKVKRSSLTKAAIMQWGLFLARAVLVMEQG